MSFPSLHKHYHLCLRWDHTLAACRPCFIKTTCCFTFLASSLQFGTKILLPSGFTCLVHLCGPRSFVCNPEQVHLFLDPIRKSPHKLGVHLHSHNSIWTDFSLPFLHLLPWSLVDTILYPISIWPNQRIFNLGFFF